MLTLKDHVAGKVHFQFYRKGELFYKTDSGFEFRVPCHDTGDGVFLAEDKGMMFMRYIKKELNLAKSPDLSKDELELFDKLQKEELE